MAQMGITVPTAHFGTVHTMTVVSMVGDGIDIHLSIKAGPATAGIKLGRRVEKGLMTTDTAIGAVILFVDISTGKRGLGTGLAGHKILIFSQLLSPLRVGFFNFVRHVLHNSSASTERHCKQSCTKIQQWSAFSEKKAGLEKAGKTRFSDLREREYQCAVKKGISAP
jgi:hypothetical protein